MYLCILKDKKLNTFCMHKIFKNQCKVFNLSFDCITVNT